MPLYFLGRRGQEAVFPGGSGPAGRVRFDQGPNLTAITQHVPHGHVREGLCHGGVRPVQMPVQGAQPVVPPCVEACCGNLEPTVYLTLTPAGPSRTIDRGIIRTQVHI